MEHPIGAVARAAGVSVRTLHHYDAVGAVRPSGRSSSGYRLYDDSDVLRLRRVLAYRRVGLSLADIVAVLDDPGADAVERLVEQHGALRRRLNELEEQLAELERAIARERTREEAAVAAGDGMGLSEQELREVFGEHDPRQHADEAERRWGRTDAYAESQRRTSAYTVEDWTRQRAEADAVEARLAGLLSAGADPAGEEAMDAAEAHRALISAWFYACDHETHVGLADLYVSDERFREHYDSRVPGLAEFVRDAIYANALRQG